MLIAVKNGKEMEKGVNLMAQIDNEEVLTTKEAMEFLKISKPTFLKCIRTRKIKATKVGNGWRVLRSELFRCLSGGGEK
jgi:excisionase family DNA binding protein